MRVLLASDHYPPFIGGAHRQARLLARGMRARGHAVDVVTPWHGGMPPTEDEDGVTVHRVRQIRTAIRALVRDPRQRHQPPFPDPVTILGLRRIIRDTRPDLIHSYGWITFSVAAALGRRRIPLLVSARDYGYFCATRTLLRKNEPCSGPAPLKCLACATDYYGPTKGWLATAGVALSKPIVERRMTGLHSVSTYVEEVTLRHLAGSGSEGRELVRVVLPSFQEPDPSAADEDSEDVAHRLERLPQEPFILYVGAFRKVKGLEVLFDAYRQLANPPPLVLMGTFERDSPEHIPGEAVVMADVPHRVVMAAWERAMFGVMPSLWPEPLGSTVAEGMSMGKPVIGTAPGGHADMLDRETGLLVPGGDVDALAAAMESLISDPDRRQAFGKAAAERARSFAASAVLPGFERAYEQVIAASGRPRAADPPSPASG